MKREPVVVDDKKYYIIIRPTLSYIEQQNPDGKRVRVVGCTAAQATERGMHHVGVMNSILEKIGDKQINKAACIRLKATLLKA